MNTETKTEWRLVPVEPTREMVKAAENAFFDWKYRGTSGDFTHTDVFNAMLAAAPTPPKSEGCDRNAVIEECLQCYSPDDSATDWADKIRRLKL